MLNFEKIENFLALLQGMIKGLYNGRTFDEI